MQCDSAISNQSLGTLCLKHYEALLRSFNHLLLSQKQVLSFRIILVHFFFM